MSNREQVAAELRAAVAQFETDGGVTLGAPGHLCRAVLLIADRIHPEPGANILPFPGWSVRVPA